MSKNVIRLTESDIHRMVMEAVNEYRRGYVNPDGNHMTGGEFGSSNRYGISTISIDKLVPDEWFDDGKFESFKDYFLKHNHNSDEIIIEAVINESFDEPTGYGNKFNPIPEIKGRPYYDEKIYKGIINSCPFLNELDKEYIFNSLQEYIDSLKVDDFVYDSYGKY